MVTHPDLGRVTMNVSKETFFTSVLHFDGTACAHGQKGGVYLQADVFARTEGTSNSTEN
jgi:hypothetical protein